RRFLKDRCDGLFDEARPGRPRTINDDQVAAVIERTLRTTPADATHWSIRSHGFVARIDVGSLWGGAGRADSTALYGPSANDRIGARFDRDTPAGLDRHLLTNPGFEL